MVSASLRFWQLAGFADHPHVISFCYSLQIRYGAQSIDFFFFFTPTRTISTPPTDGDALHACILYLASNININININTKTTLSTAASGICYLGHKHRSSSEAPPKTSARSKTCRP